MTATYAPNGLTPTRIRGGAPNSNGTNEYPIKSGDANTIFTGQPVRVSAGHITAVISVGLSPVGVFQGCRYVEDGEQKFKPFWPGGTSATNAVGFVVDNPAQVYEIQCDASVTAAAVGATMSFNAVTSGSTFTGRSGAGADGSTVNTTGLDLKVIRVVDEPGNVTGDAKTKIEVLLNLHEDNFRNVFVTAPVTTTN
jgi:hypothetical protein|tara:strand:+ start:210 stop:797 length:588 start_codon:yes stop_codon:yes gene_type:complete